MEIGPNLPGQLSFCETEGSIKGSNTFSPYLICSQALVPTDETKDHHAEWKKRPIKASTSPLTVVDSRCAGGEEDKTTSHLWWFPPQCIPTLPQSAAYSVLKPDVVLTVLIDLEVFFF